MHFNPGGMEPSRNMTGSLFQLIHHFSRQGKPFPLLLLFYSTSEKLASRRVFLHIFATNIIIKSSENNKSDKNLFSFSLEEEKEEETVKR